MEFEKSAVPRKGQDDNLLPPLCVGRNVGTKTELSRRREADLPDENFSAESRVYRVQSGARFKEVEGTGTRICL